jgi:isoquinoline 1-oxidoreductase alpha subunit
LTTLTINGKTHALSVAPETPLLWVLRDELGLTGTKFGCGIAYCGACTVAVDGVATRSCVMPIAALEGKSIQTIEGEADAVLAALQKAWLAYQAPQCGYCQSGMLMAASSLLKQNPSPSKDDIDRAITNICRCGTYQRVRAAIESAAAALRGDKP